MRRTAMVLCMALGLSACGLENSVTTSQLSGIYQLDTINGGVLPYTFQGGATVTGEVLTMNGDGSYIDIVQYSSGSSFTETGFFVTGGSSVEFRPDNVGIADYNGSISGSTLITVSGGVQSVYHKI